MMPSVETIIIFYAVNNVCMFDIDFICLTAREKVGGGRLL